MTIQPPPSVPKAAPIVPEPTGTGRKTLMLILAIFMTLGGILATLVLETLLMAGSPNSSEVQLRVIKTLMLAGAVICVVSVGGAIWAMIAHRPGLAAVIGGIPIVTFLVIFIWAWVAEV